MKNKHLRLSIGIALVALTLSLLFLSGTGRHVKPSTTQTTLQNVPRLETHTSGAR